MSRTPAATMARLKVTYPSWTFTKAADRWHTVGYVAERGDEVVQGITLGELESRLMSRARDLAVDAGPVPPRAADQIAQAAMDVIDAAGAEGKLPG